MVQKSEQSPHQHRTNLRLHTSPEYVPSKQWRSEHVTLGCFSITHTDTMVKRFETIDSVSARECTALDTFLVSTLVANTKAQVSISVMDGNGSTTQANNMSHCREGASHYSSSPYKQRVCVRACVRVCVCAREGNERGFGQKPDDE